MGRAGPSGRTAIPGGAVPLGPQVARTYEPLMSEIPPCPKCQSTYAYEDGQLLVCPECAHEWSRHAPPAPAAEERAEEGLVVRDANGNRLQDGDTVVVVKDLKVKGAPTALKAGTRVRNVRLVDGDHNLDCRIDGFGAMALKSEFVKKA